MKHLLLAVSLAILSYLPTDVFSQSIEPQEALPYGVSEHQTTYQGMPITYAQAGDPSKPGLFFVHGTPGSWQAFTNYLADPQLQRDYFMISVDRPGWGNSKNDDTTLDMKRFHFQASAMLEVLEQFSGKQWLVIGHSLGASIAPKMAILAPDKIQGLLLLAGSLKPSLGRARWYNLAASFWVIRWAVPAGLKYSNDEIMVLRTELQALEAQIESSMPDIRVAVMQGMKDKLVSPKNIDYVAEHWPAFISDLALIQLPEAGHFLPWKNADRVKQAIAAFNL